eukprot:gene13428-15824_t
MEPKAFEQFNLSVRRQDVDRAAEKGDIGFIEQMYRESPLNVSETASICAARAGQIEVIKYLDQLATSKDIFSQRTMKFAARGGKLNVIQYLHYNRTEGCTTDAMDDACSSGYLEVVEYLHNTRTEGCSDEAIDEAAASNHVDIVKFLYLNRTEGCTLRAFAYASHPYSLTDCTSCIEYLRDLPCRKDCHLCHNERSEEVWDRFQTKVNANSL